MTAFSPFIDGDLHFTPHMFELPLNHNDSDGEHISIFARSVSKGQEALNTQPWLVYLQGGPGFPSPRAGRDLPWLKRACDTYNVLLLDQRGTGHSSVVSAQTLSNRTPEQQAEYLTHFRADSIVRDAECIREQLGIKKWSLLGQSFGGFCTLTYLSFYPQSLTRCYITGGIAPVAHRPDQVYQATFARTEEKNRAFFNQFPAAQGLCQAIADHLLDHDEYLPNGQKFTVEQFQQIGINFGLANTFLSTYYLLENALIQVDGKTRLRHEFLHQMYQEQVFHINPIYALLHESIYCQGFASNWSAHRVRETIGAFDYQKGQPFLFTGEMVFPWMFDQYTSLQPLKKAADILAKKQDWCALYDEQKLKHNTVPLACVVYAEDMFVDLDLSRQTLAGLGSHTVWITNEFEHNGLRTHGEKILETLIQMASNLENHQWLANKAK